MTAQTFLQYAKAERDRARTEYGISVADATEFYPDTMLRPVWVQSLVAFAAAGGDIPPSVARTMSDTERYAVNKFGYSNTRFI